MNDHNHPEDLQALLTEEMKPNFFPYLQWKVTWEPSAFIDELSSQSFPEGMKQLLHREWPKKIRRPTTVLVTLS